MKIYTSQLVDDYFSYFANGLGIGVFKQVTVRIKFKYCLYCAYIVCTCDLRLILSEWIILTDMVNVIHSAVL